MGLPYTHKLVMADQPGIVVVKKQRKKALVIVISIPSDSNIKKMENLKLEN